MGLHGFMVILVSVGLFIGLYLVGSGVWAWAQTKAAPRVDMFLCDKHGPIPREGTITFLGSESCGICFHERMRKAEKGQF